MPTATRWPNTPSAVKGRRNGSRTVSEPGGCRRAPFAGLAPQQRRRAGEHKAHGVVELPNTGKTRTEGDLAEGQFRGLDQQAGGLRALRPRQRRAGRHRPRPRDDAPAGAWNIRPRDANPVTPSRSTTPSAIRRIARPTMSVRRFHSGEPGEASGRQRLQARNPACWAAAAVGQKRMFLAYGGRTGQLGRQ